MVDVINCEKKNLLQPSMPIVSASGSTSRELTSIETDDGYILVLEHLVTTISKNPNKTPIVLCPGFGGNRFNFDLDENHSLAVYLANEGFDIWIAELRGHGRSKLRSSTSFKGRKYGWSMDDHIEKDMPTILKAITKSSRHPKVIWIGHSLGGMIAYGLLARNPGYKQFLAGLITIGSPGHVQSPKRLVLLPLITFFMKRLKKMGTLPTRLFIRFIFSSAGKRFGLSRFWDYWMNPKNMADDVLAATVRFGAEDFSPGTLYQWLISMRKNSLVSSDGSFDYFENMSDINIPVLFIAGSADKIAPVSSIKTVFERVKSKNRRMRVFGVQGFELTPHSQQKLQCDSINYGHDDLILGEASRQEVFPYIVNWLRDQCKSSRY